MDRIPYEGDVGKRRKNEGEMIMGSKTTASHKAVPPTRISNGGA